MCLHLKMKITELEFNLREHQRIIRIPAPETKMKLTF